MRIIEVHPALKINYRDKISLLALALFLGLAFTSRGQYDIRKTKWSMTMQEVLDSEKPLVGIENNSQTDLIDLKYKAISVDNFTADITYSFKNGKLYEVTYTMYDKTKPEISFSQSILFTKSIIATLIKGKQMFLHHCWSGNMTSATIKSICLYDDQSITFIENSMKKRENNFFTFGIKNARVYTTITKNLYDVKLPNLICVITFTPIYEADTSGF